MRASSWILLAAAATSLTLQGCRREGCLGGEEGCRLPSPCQALAFTCEGGAVAIRRLEAAEPSAGGLDGMGARGDILLSNGQVRAVIAGLGNANYLDPGGGSLLDLTTGAANDGLNQVLQVVGILPADAARYTSLELIDEPGRVGVQLRGTLDGRPDLPISTLYELRPCDRGVRIRTEVVNGSPDPALWALADGFYWNNREAVPFTSAGFTHQGFNLLTIDDAFERFPFLAASAHAPPAASYAEVACQQKQLTGFQSEAVSSSGLSRTVVPPRGYLVFERFLAVADGAGVAPAVDVALEARRQLFGEAFITLRGTVARAGGAGFGSEREASVLILEPATQGTPTAWSQVVPDANGAWSARVPKGRALKVEAHAFGQKQLEREIPALDGDEDLGVLQLPGTARVTVAVMEGQTGRALDAEIFVVPQNAEARAAVTGSLHGAFGNCAPWLGPPVGTSPACNRFLVGNGQATVELPPGPYHLYAFKGPFWTLQRQTVTLTPAVSTLTFSLEKLPLQPAGTLGADLHVHGAASFDSSLPDEDRVRSFSALELDVIAATDHDVVTDYGETVRRLSLQDRLTTLAGLETTGHIPFLRIPNYAFPLVIGHYNFWPLKYLPDEPHNGGPDDERVEPGQLFDAMASRFDSDVPVIQLNHPWADPEFGRDLGYPRALGLNTKQNLPASDDGTAAGMYVRSPGQAANNSHHAQEVMNGTRNDSLLAYRAFWFYLLSQGQLKAGTANSDSHALAGETVGVPRNVVYANTQAGPTFKVDVFDRALRNGELFGTNGPVIEATVDGPGGPRAFSLTPFAPVADAKLHLKISAAPWVPVQEIRIIVNGAVAKVLTGAALSTPADPFGKDGLVRYQGDVPLSELLPAGGDAWLVVEAGRPLPLAGDLAGITSLEPDGIPDTSDNNGDGVVDRSDVDEGEDSGPLRIPPVPANDLDPQFHFSQVVTDGYPFAFTNPFILDRDGNGTFDAPRVKGGL